MVTIDNFYATNIDSVEYSCMVFFKTTPPVPFGAEYYISINGEWKVVFPNEINPGEYYQRVFDLKNGDNKVQLRIDNQAESYSSEIIDVLVEGQEVVPEPPRVPTPPIVKGTDVEIVRKLPCKIEYDVNSEDPIIEHWYSLDNGKSWDNIEPGYDGNFYFPLYFVKPGSYVVKIKVMDNYWDESEPIDIHVKVVPGEGDEPGLNASTTDEFIIKVDMLEPEPEDPRLWYVVIAGTYPNEATAAANAKKLTSNGFEKTIYEKHER